MESTVFNSDNINLSMPSAMVHTKLNTIRKQLGNIRQISKLTYLYQKLRKTNHVYTLLSALTAKKTIKLVVIYIHSGNTTSIRDGIQRSIKNSMKTKLNPFVQLQAVETNDFEKLKDFFTECLKKLHFN